MIQLPHNYINTIDHRQKDGQLFVLMKLLAEILIDKSCFNTEYVRDALVKESDGMYSEYEYLIRIIQDIILKAISIHREKKKSGMARANSHSRFFVSAI